MKRLVLILLTIPVIVSLVGCGTTTEVETPSQQTSKLVIQELPISDITEISVVVSWLTNEPASSKVSYGLTSSSEDFDITDERLSSTHSIELKWLQPDTSYRYKIYAQDTHGNEAISNENVFRTKAIPLDKGIIIGSVLYDDGTPASKTYIYVFKDEDLLCFAFGITDTDGHYVFKDLPFGRYEIYSSEIELGLGCEWWEIEKDIYRPFMRSPEVINLTKNELRIASTRTHFREIKMHFLGEYLNTNQPEISWEPVPTASYYKVEIVDGYLNEKKHEDYGKEITVSDTSIIWPEQLIEMNYMISVYAYDENGTYLTDTYELFWIGPKESNYD